jgi:hypothetical protein
MANNGSKVNITEYIREAKTVSKDLNVSGQNVLRLVVENAGSTNTLQVTGRIYNQHGYVVIDNLTGNGTKDFNVELYDYVTIECTQFNSITDLVRIVGSSFSNTSITNKQDATSVTWDEINTTFPTTVTELYTYKYQSNTVQTILVTYDSTSKKIIVSVHKTRF